MNLAWTPSSTYTPTSTHAPPPYDSVVKDTHQFGKFTSVDFLPRCYGGWFNEQKCEDFSSLVHKANHWLRIYPRWKLITCESVEFSYKNRSVKSEKMAYTEYGELDNSYVRGLRLWIRERNGSTKVQQIGYVNLIPQETVAGGVFSRPLFESLPELVNRFNSVNRINPIPGRILTVESQAIRTGSWNVKADRSKWKEKGDRSGKKGHKNFVFIIRIFFEIMPAEPEEIGLADFLPDMMESGGVFTKPIYEPFSNVVEKASRWWSSQSGLRLCNAQSLDIKIKKGGINPYRMEYLQSCSKTTYYARVLRLAYVRSSRVNINNGVPYSIRRLVCKTFVPIQLEKSLFHVKFETLSETKERVSAWIRATGAHVISAETATLRFHLGCQAKNVADAAFTYSVAKQNEHRIFIIRLYMYEHLPRISTGNIATSLPNISAQKVAL